MTDERMKGQEKKSAKPMKNKTGFKIAVRTGLETGFLFVCSKMKLKHRGPGLRGLG